jgi:hypothetical protein
VAESETKENLKKLLTRLKINEEKVSKEILRSRYRAAYSKLTKGISTAGNEYLKDIVIEELGDDYKKIAESVGKYPEQMGSVFVKICAKDDYSARIRAALYVNYNVDEVEKLGREAGRQLRADALNMIKTIKSQEDKNGKV